MAANSEIKEQILSFVPQKPPFQFIDEILELDDEHIVGTYRFREDEYFYLGHFPERPITPGVILIETMAQTGVVAFGLYLNMIMISDGKPIGATNGLITLFTFVESVEFTKVVRPGERVIIHGQKLYFRKGNLKSKVRMERENGETVSFGILAGMGVPSSKIGF